MIKINDSHPLSGLNRARKSGKAGSSGFADFLGETEESAETPSAAPMREAAAPASVASLLSLQEMPADTGVQRKALQQSRQSVDMLDTLRRDILLGRTDEQSLHQLEHQLKQIERQKQEAPKLVPLLEEIELRLAVELAKLEKLG